MVNLDIYKDPSRDAVQALRSNIVEVEVRVFSSLSMLGVVVGEDSLLWRVSSQIFGVRSGIAL